MNKIAGPAGTHIIGNYFAIRAISFRSVDNYTVTVIRAAYIFNDSNSNRYQNDVT